VTNAGLDLLSDPDTAQATYDVVRGVAAGLVMVLAGYTLYHLTADVRPASGLVLLMDQTVCAVSAIAFWLMLRRRIPVNWAHGVVALLGLLIAGDTAATVVIQGEGSDLQFMQAVALAGGTLVLSGRALGILLLGTAAMAIPSAALVSSRDGLMDFIVMQTATSMFAVALYCTRVRAQEKLLRACQRASEAAHKLGRALGRAGREFAELERSNQQRCELEERLRQAQKIEALGTLAGGLAHDMNNVLGAITAAASTALESCSAEVRSELMDVLAAARRGETLTRNILSFARPGPTQTAPFRVDAVAQEVGGLLGRMLPKSIILDLRCQAGESWVEGDAGQVSHLLTNLCLNSADAIQGQGRIQVSTRPVELNAEQARQLGTVPGRYVELSVEDTGCGIPAEVQARVFEPYFSTKLDQQHSGLGLSMVYATIQQHHGGIALQSTVGRGTTVTVVLPSRREAPSESVLRRPRMPRVDTVRNHLLFVDDEPLLRRAGRRIAARLGFQVHLAADGREALELFIRHPTEIGAVVLDLAMPVMSGEECLRQLRELDSALPVVLASGFPKDYDVQKLLEDPHTRYVLKPYEFMDLAEALASLLGVRSRASTTLAAKEQALRGNESGPWSTLGKDGKAPHP
jgi:signal transduction histidine kinase/DNA-binding NarL/FixJ family response regulator